MVLPEPAIGFYLSLVMKTPGNAFLNTGIYLLIL